MLMFKEDVKQLETIEIVSEIVEVDANASVEQHRLDVETTINQAHLYQNGVLRCCLSLANGASYTHVFVFQVDLDVDRMYMILKFPDQFQESLETEKGKTPGDTSKAARSTYDETITKWINVQEHKISKNNTLAGLVINSDFATSCIVTAP